MANNEPDLDQNELFMNGLGVLQWVDDVAEFRCTRCQRILVQHYISNCDHKFCFNCKRVVNNASEQWKCPKCGQYIQDMERQDLEFKDRVPKLKLFCPNRKYGCDHVTPFKQIKEHLEICEYTGERALSALYIGEPNPDILFELQQLKREMMEMRQMIKIEKNCLDTDANEEQKSCTWDLSLEVDQMKRELINVNNILSEFKSETTKLKNEIKKLREQPIRSNASDSEKMSLAVEENKAKISKLEDNAETYNQMINYTNNNNNNLMQQLRNEMDSKQVKIEITNGTKAKTENDKKMAEMIKKLDEKEDTTEVDAKFNTMNAQIETFKITNKVENSDEINRKMKVIKKKINNKNCEMTQKVKVMKVEMATQDEKLNDMETTMEGNRLQIQSNDEKHKEQMQRLRKELKTENTEMESKMETFEQTMYEMKHDKDIVKGVIYALNEVEEKREEVTSKMSKNSSQINKNLTEINKNTSDINKLSSTVENLSRDLQADLLNQAKLQAEEEDEKTESKKKMTEMRKKLNQKATKNEVDKKLKYNEIKADGNLLIIKKEIDEKISECNEKITKLEKIIKENQSIANSIDIHNLEINVFNLQLVNVLTNPQMNMFALAEEKSNFRPDFSWKIHGIQDKVKQENFELKSEVFEWTGYPIRARAKLEVTDKDFLRLSLSLIEQKEGAAVDLKLIPHVYYLVRDQTRTKSPKHKCSTSGYLFTSKFDYSFDFDASISPKSLQAGPPYAVDDSIVVDIYTEPPRIARRSLSCDGSLDWAIDHYEKRKRKEEQELVLHHESPYFYARGYRVQARMWLGQRLSAAILFLPGEHDARLPLTFPHRTTVTFFNRKNPRRSITATVDQDIDREQEYWIDVCADEELENVIENDVIFYNVTIKPLLV